MEHSAALREWELGIWGRERGSLSTLYAPTCSTVNRLVYASVIMPLFFFIDEESEDWRD